MKKKFRSLPVYRQTLHTDQRKDDGFSAVIIVGNIVFLLKGIPGMEMKLPAAKLQYASRMFPADIKRFLNGQSGVIFLKQVLIITEMNNHGYFFLPYLILFV